MIPAESQKIPTESLVENFLYHWGLGTFHFSALQPLSYSVIKKNAYFVQIWTVEQVFSIRF